MSWWIELHCDRLADPPDKGKGQADRPHCYTHRNANPGLLIANQHPDHAFKLLRKEALAKGWKYKRRCGWICPYCQTQPEKK